MDRARWLLALLVAACLFWTPSVSPAIAETETEVYELPSHANWDHGDLSVLIVPPAHGQLFNFGGGALNGGDPNELTPFNSYLEAIEAAIDGWDKGIELLGADWLKEYYAPTVYVLGRDTVPQEVLTSPDILVITDENEGPLLGTSIWGKTGHVRTPCIVRMSSSYFGSFSFPDMFNIAAQEFGHCLGLNHVGSQGGVDPASDLKQPEHDVMNGFYTHPIGETDTHLHCISNLDIAALEHVFDYEMDYSAVLNLGVEGITHIASSEYGDTCELPPADWRERTPPPFLPGAAPMNSSIDRPLDDSKIRVDGFSRVLGRASVDQSQEEIPYEVAVAIAKIETSGPCLWWDRRSGSLAERDCYSPIWESAELVGTERWIWKAPKGLPAGEYRVVARVLTRYGNEPLQEDNVATFRLTEPRGRGRSHR